MVNSNKIGILDPDGLNPNPLTNHPYSDNYKVLASKWKTFPVYQKVDQIIEDINSNQVYLVVASTGSGKSVLVPKIVLHTFNYNAKIVMTLPKQMITKSSAEFAALTLDVKLGHEVGYQYRGSPKDSKSDQTKLLYATDGTIRARLLKDPALRDFDCVIIDEAHERSVQIDFLIYLLRNTLRIRPEFKLVIMSATINVEIFQNYFRDFRFKQIDVGGARTFPIESVFYPKEITYNIAKTEGFRILIKILETDTMDNPNEAHDIIFFVTSSNEAFDLCKMLHSHIAKEKKGPSPGTNCKITCKGDVYCVELFSGMDKEKEKLAVDKDAYKSQNGSTKYNRKVVISTNVAESSLTVDGIKYVIDTGYQLKDSYDIKTRSKKLDTELISKSQATQRMGRAGRTEPGICYHLYTQDQYENKMKKFPEPNIRISDITSECLNLISQESVETVDKLTEILVNFIEPPTKEFIRFAVKNMEQVGAIKNGQVTPLGRVLEGLPANDIYIGLGLLYSKIYNCSHEFIQIVAITDTCKRNVSEIYNLTSMKLRDAEDEEEKKRVEKMEQKFKESRKTFYKKYGDHLSLLNIYKHFKDYYSKHINQEKSVIEWCDKYFLKRNILMKIIRNEKVLRQRFQDCLHHEAKHYKDLIQINDEVKALEIDEKILWCLASSGMNNIATKSTDGTTYRTHYTSNVKVNKISFLYMNKKLPKNIYYSELFTMSGKTELNVASHIPKSVAKLLN